MAPRLRRPFPVPRALYTEWWWPPSPTVYRTVPAGYDSFENLLLPEVEPAGGASFLWAHGFKLVGGGSGHLGLQVDRGEKRAVFIIEGSNAATGSSNGNGFSVPFNWVAGHEYALRVWTESEGFWSALVQDQTTGQSVPVGTLVVPMHWRRLASWSIMSTEYLGAPLNSCQDLPRVSAVFGPPTANEGRYEPDRSSTRLGDGTCEVSWAENTALGVRHQMGM